MKRIPLHVAIIMDGNGRWAKERNLPRYIGHRVGSESVRDVIEVSLEKGIRYLTLYTFSTENWQRPREEVEFLMRLFERLIGEEIPILKDKGVKFDITGDENLIPEFLKERIQWAKKETMDCNSLNLYLAFSYGGRREIIHAVKTILNRGVKELDENTFREFLYHPEMPDPDMLIRTGGEKRISNFLLWQVAYTELFFTDTLWPDFRRDEFLEMLEEFALRDRRFGKVK